MPRGLRSVTFKHIAMLCHVPTRTGQEALLPLCFLIQSGPQPPGKLAQDFAVQSMIFKYFAERNYKQYTTHKQSRGLQRCIFDQDIVLRSATLEAAFNLSALGLSCFIIAAVAFLEMPTMIKI